MLSFSLYFIYIYIFNYEYIENNIGSVKTVVDSKYIVSLHRYVRYDKIQ